MRWQRDSSLQNAFLSWCKGLPSCSLPEGSAGTPPTTRPCLRIPGSRDVTSCKPGCIRMQTKTSRWFYIYPHNEIKYKEAVGSFPECKLAHVHRLDSHNPNTFFLCWDERQKGFK